MMTQQATVRDGARTRVMLVDDSAVIRGIMRRWIDAEPHLEVIATAIDGRDAIKLATTHQPDLIVLDLEMPVLGGLEALPELKSVVPHAKIIIASTLSTRNARISLAALNAGATDYLAKPEAGQSRDAFRDDLLQKLNGLVSAQRAQSAPMRQQNHRAWQGTPDALAFGASTGGPQALVNIFAQLRERCGKSAVFVTQHMPKHFTMLLGDELAALAGLDGGEAVDGDAVRPGHLYLAPGGLHMRVVQRGEKRFIELCDEPAINFCKPAVDPMFSSIANTYKENCLGVVLTGMGNDGASGALALHQTGAYVLAQDQATSTVWGMPQAAIAAGAVSNVLPLEQIGAELVSHLSKRGAL
jgi:two-component system chemotaxis response regulator CheB